MTFASDFEKRHEERFRGSQFDWLDFQRDGQSFPVPNRADPMVSPPQEIVLAPNDGGAERQLTRLGLRPAGTDGWLQPFDAPLKPAAGFSVLRGNLFDDDVLPRANKRRRPS